NQYPPINYFPASAYQTPIFQLLKSHPYEALTFIVDFTNRSILKYVESTYDQTVNKVSLIIDNKEYLVYSSQGIWNTYMGNSSPTVPDLIQSIHMALERYLLEVLEGSIESQVIEKILVEFLLK